MKKNLKYIYIPHKTILITLFITIAGTTIGFCNPSPPPPSVVWVQQPEMEIDFYMIPMIIMVILFAFFYILKKKLAFNTKI